MPKGATWLRAVLVAVLLSEPARAEPVFAEGDLLLVRGRLRDCPDRLRLVEVSRVEARSLAIADLGSFGVVGRTPAQVLHALRLRLSARLPGSPVPPIAIERASDADSQDEAMLLIESRDDLRCRDFMPDSFKRPDRRPSRLYERLAAR